MLTIKTDSQYQEAQSRLSQLSNISEPNARQLEAIGELRYAIEQYEDRIHMESIRNG